MWAPEIGFFYGALAGACAGFLFFNAHPARVFMGDTGSLAIGMGLAAAALAAKQEILLLIVGLVYVAEIASMMIQRYVFKYRRIRFGIDYARAHRVFRRAPLHHHFEELGWRETQVVARFYVVGLIAAAVGMLLLPRLSSLPMPALSTEAGGAVAPPQGGNPR
jgi:phospho-N-acetylmuramoyl-pentapeptide-transferase